MKKLETTYLGLTLRSPLIVSSSRLTATLAGLIEAEKNGAGAVVLKSIFEEQIHHEINTVDYQGAYPEAEDYISYYLEKNSVAEYLNLIKDAKKNLSIPVIASVNCYSSRGWIDFAKDIAESGADALEVNVFFLPTDRKKSSWDEEQLYLELIEKLTGRIKIPLVIKLGFRFSNILNMIDQFYMRGVKGVVLFNRFYEPDIDTDRMTIVPAGIFSSAGDMRNVLRWVAMSSAMNLGINISASTGVHSGNDAIKYLLAGADTVQVCSVLYSNGISYLKTINSQVEKWMSDKGFNDIDEFRGKLNWKNIDQPAVYERTQFMKYFSSAD